MFRKIVLTALLSVAALGGLTVATPVADAAPLRSRFYHGTEYRVVYNNRGCWDVYGTYGNRNAAERVARNLRHRHFAVRIDAERC